MAGNKLTAGTNNLLAVIGDEETVVGMLSSASASSREECE